MALTFGTLLSSQIADAQQLDPSGPRHWLDVQHYAGFRCPRQRQVPVRQTLRSARRREKVTCLGRRCQTAPE